MVADAFDFRPRLLYACRQPQTPKELHVRTRMTDPNSVDKSWGVHVQPCIDTAISSLHKIDTDSSPAIRSSIVPVQYLRYHFKFKPTVVVVWLLLLLLLWLLGCWVARLFTAGVVAVF